MKEIEEERQDIKKTLIKEVIFFLAIFLFNFFVVRNYIAEGVTVKGASMQNTLYNNERLFVDRIPSHVDGIGRFDIVIFDPQNKVDKYWIKRVVGLPGEKVQIIGENIYINDQILEEHYGKEPIINAGIFAEPYTLAEDEYFVLGDNRQHSTDSRVVGPIKKNVMKGKAVFRFWPLNRLGELD